MTSPLLALPVLFVPSIFFVVNRPAFVWSLLALCFTIWRLYRTKRDTAVACTPMKRSISQLVFATFLLQMLALAWIGAVWMLEGAGRLVMSSDAASRIVGWVQAHWFADLAAWVVLFGVVCGLFRLGRPVVAWHQRAIRNAALAFRTSSR